MPSMRDEAFVLLCSLRGAEAAGEARADEAEQEVIEDDGFVAGRGGRLCRCSGSGFVGRAASAAAADLTAERSGVEERIERRGGEGRGVVADVGGD
ncbi:hypothetical protein AXG93_3102s1220 [Marchantia polymorpha subsp. ruderalis]|uniref:Uncharacterized protein n=1 Tax=Marchantia polymorpha subsp. ruderalis TaxID=1480154 RepID=A0A176WB21_MARPO|nr:hypothetical protein AXG93_3102s1220 [Marchantia polymorpha subsp. ruderalis]